MVALADAVLVLTQAVSPPAVPLVDFTVADAAIVQWNAARLGVQPSAATLAAVTQVQVDGYYQGLRRTDGNAAILAANNVALRALCYALLDQLNVIRSKLVPALGAVTTAQALAAIKAKIDAGGAD